MNKVFNGVNNNGYIQYNTGVLIEGLKFIILIHKKAETSNRLP